LKEWEAERSSAVAGKKQKVKSSSINLGPTTSDSLLATGSDEVLVRVEGVSKKFCRSLKRSLWYGLCDIAGELSPFGRRDIAEDRRLEMVDGAQSSISHIPYTPAVAARDEDLREGEFYAVRDVSFELRRGECLGLIGHNGAGKTTLLKMLNGLIKPDTGRIEMNGRVGALIALGAGFNPILTGRENIYINGSVLGLSKKEINDKIDEVIDFAEIGEFIDMPVQNYSSGMQVRLGFAAAAVMIKPDILILDEVLAVGDISFMMKCLNAVNNLARDSAVLFVSHNMRFVSLICQRAIVLQRGRILLNATTSDAITKHHEMAEVQSGSAGSGGAVCEDVKLACAPDANAEPVHNIRYGQEGFLSMCLSVSSAVDSANLQIYITDESNTAIVCVPAVDACGRAKGFRPGKHWVLLCLGKIDLTAGLYSITVAVTGNPDGIALVRQQGLAPFIVHSDRVHWGKILRPAVVE
jgi:lipopolysaccharide transport system ATP-binding protein